MLIGNVSEVKQRENERQILSRELGRQGLRGNNSDIVMGNLSKYNNEGLSVDNNFISNSFNSTSNSIGRQLNSFSETILQKFQKSGKDRVPNEEFAQTDQDVQDTQEVENLIDLVYKTELPFAEIQDTSAEKLQAKLINYHISLTEIIKELDTIIPVSEKVCNDQ
jgi:hypothetical protein